MIVFGRRHPTELTLSRFADGDLPPRRLRRVGRHVERCESCRDYVRFIHELGDAARELKEHGTPDVSEIADAVIRRRRAGERVHLPDVPLGARPDRTGADRAGAVRTRKRRRFAEVAVAGLALVAVAAGYLLFAPSAAATRGELTFEPATGGPDASVPVIYSPAYFLADEDSLRLRAEVRQRDIEAHGVRRVAEPRTVTLHRDDKGLFRGTLPVEERDLFAVVAVEDFEGVDLDTNLGRLWDLYLEHEDGRPTMAALEGHYRALEDYNWVMAAEWAERLIEQHPDHPLGWALRYRGLSRGGIGLVPDSVRQFHRRTLDTLILRAGPEPEPGVLTWLAWYAGHLDEATTRDSLFEELRRIAPYHPWAVDRLVAETTNDLGFGSPTLVDRLEELWAAGDGATPLLIRTGVKAAAAAGRADALDAWIDRGLRHRDVRAAMLADDLARYAQDDRATAWRARLLRMSLTALAVRDDARRPLRMTAGEAESDRQAAILRREIELAGVLADLGDEAEAADLYRKAADRAWLPEDIRPYVDFLLARGDTTGALPGIGLLVADPVSGDSAHARHAQTIEGRIDDPEAFVARGRAELRRRLLAALPVDRKLRGDTRLALPTGEELTAAGYFADSPTVILRWDTRYPQTWPRLTTFKELASREAARGSALRAAIVVPPTDAEGLASIVTGGVPLVVDPAYELIAQIGVGAVVSFAVVDRQLGVVSDLSDPATAFRIAHLLTR